MLSERLDLDLDELKFIARNQFKYIDNFNLFISYLIEDGT